LPGTTALVPTLRKNRIFEQITQNHKTLAADTEGRRRSGPACACTGPVGHPRHVSPAVDEGGTHRKGM